MSPLIFGKGESQWEIPLVEQEASPGRFTLSILEYKSWLVEFWDLEKAGRQNHGKLEFPNTSDQWRSGWVWGWECVGLVGFFLHFLGKFRPVGGRWGRRSFGGLVRDTKAKKRANTPQGSPKARPKPVLSEQHCGVPTGPSKSQLL